MTGLRVPQEAVEAAAKAIFEWEGPGEQIHWAKLSEGQRESFRGEARAALDAAFDVLGMTEQQTRPDPQSLAQFAPQTRLCSAWVPIPRPTGDNDERG